MTELEKEIKQIIEETTNSKYISTLKVVEEDGYYELLMHLNQEQAPLHLGIQGTVDDFKNFIKEEMKFRKNNDVRYWKGVQDYVDTILDFDNKCKV